jgi:hypothetical protein
MLTKVFLQQLFEVSWPSILSLLGSVIGPQTMLSVRSFQREGTQTISNTHSDAIVFLNYFWMFESVG